MCPQGFRAVANKFAFATQQSRRLLVVVLVTVALAVMIIMLHLSRPSLEPGCTDLIKGSDGLTAVSLPPGCELRDNVPPDDRVRYLDSERKWRGLFFEKWIVCDGRSGASTPKLPLERDPHWLPSYVPRTYQFRRTVVVLPYGQAILKASPVRGEICLMPERKYISLISGKCESKFSVWK